MDDKVKAIAAVVVFVALAGGLVWWWRSRPAEPVKAKPEAVTPVPASVEPSKGGVPIMIEVGASGGLADSMMAAVMLTLREGFGGRLEVRFEDVRKDASLKVKYGIGVVPTQIFCDPSGKEIGRHEGYASEQEIIKQLKALGYDLMDMSKTDLLPE